MPSKLYIKRLSVVFLLVLFVTKSNSGPTDRAQRTSKPLTKTNEAGGRKVNGRLCGDAIKNAWFHVCGFEALGERKKRAVDFTQTRSRATSFLASYQADIPTDITEECCQEGALWRRYRNIAIDLIKLNPHLVPRRKESTADIQYRPRVKLIQPELVQGRSSWAQPHKL